MGPIAQNDQYALPQHMRRPGLLCSISGEDENVRNHYTHCSSSAPTPAPALLQRRRLPSTSASPAPRLLTASAVVGLRRLLDASPPLLRLCASSATSGAPCPAPLLPPRRGELVVDTRRPYSEANRGHRSLSCRAVIEAGMWDLAGQGGWRRPASPCTATGVDGC
jgi:hypothetical protein